MNMERACVPSAARSSTSVSAAGSCYEGGTGRGSQCREASASAGRSMKASVRARARACVGHTRDSDSGRGSRERGHRTRQVRPERPRLTVQSHQRQVSEHRRWQCAVVPQARRLSPEGPVPACAWPCRNPGGATADSKRQDRRCDGGVRGGRLAALAHPEGS